MCDERRSTRPARPPPHTHTPRPTGIWCTSRMCASKASRRPVWRMSWKKRRRSGWRRRYLSAPARPARLRRVHEPPPKAHAAFASVRPRRAARHVGPRQTDRARSHAGARQHRQRSGHSASGARYAWAPICVTTRLRRHAYRPCAPQPPSVRWRVGTPAGRGLCHSRPRYHRPHPRGVVARRRLERRAGQACRRFSRHAPGAGPPL